jgi:hypothetical protein
MAIGPQPLRSLVRCLACLYGFSLLSGCGGQAPPPQTGSAEFEAAKKDYQEARRKEHGFSSFEPPAKNKQAKK